MADAGKPDAALDAARTYGRYEDEGWRVRKDGSLFWASVVITPMRDDNGKLLGSGKVTRDLTERMQAEQRLKESEARFRGFADQCPSLMSIKNLDGRIAALGSMVTDSEARRHAERRLSETPQQLDALTCVSGAAAAGESAHAPRPGQGRFEPDTDALAQMIAHDLLAPLRNIETLASQVRDGVVELNAMAHRLDLITHSTARLTRLSNDLLMFSRSNRLNQADARIADLDSVVDDARIALAATARSRRIRWNIGKLPKVVGVPALLKVAFEQMLSNAVKFTQQCDPAVIEVAAITGDSGEVVIEIKDNGVGFSEQHAHKLFRAFLRLHGDSRFAGAGLGLITAKRIIEGHGGRVWARSRPGEGASFFFTLQAAPVVARAAQKRVYKDR